MNAMIQITIETFTEMITALANVKSLERYVNTTEYSIDREKVAAICGFELKERKENADM